MPSPCSMPPHFLLVLKNTRVEPDSHPGDGVHVAPVSTSISCKQGILRTGKNTISGLKTTISTQETAVPQGLFRSFPKQLSAKFFRPTGNSKRITGNRKALTSVGLAEVDPKLPDHPAYRSRIAKPPDAQSDAASSTRRAAARPSGRTALRPQRSPRW
jgi:hypothetical protein